MISTIYYLKYIKKKTENINQYPLSDSIIDPIIILPPKIDNIEGIRSKMKKSKNKENIIEVYVYGAILAKLVN